MVKPHIIIHCASIGSVDYAENHYTEVREVNVMGLKHVLDGANAYKSKLVYISTNAVFSGNNPPYNENSALNPVNAYGIIKREAEQLVKALCNEWLIIRPFLLYGWPYPGGRTNWAKNIIDKLSKDESLKMVNDHIWQPTYAVNCAETIWQLLSYTNDTFNISCQEKVTLYDFALRVCQVFNLNPELIEPVSSDYFKSIAKRPENTTYDLTKLNRLNGS